MLTLETCVDLEQQQLACVASCLVFTACIVGAKLLSIAGCTMTMTIWYMPCQPQRLTTTICLNCRHAKMESNDVLAPHIIILCQVCVGRPVHAREAKLQQAKGARTTVTCKAMLSAPIA